MHEPVRPAATGKRRLPLSRPELARLSATYWWVVAVAAVFTLARFSEAFLILRAQQAGLAIVLVPAVLVLMNVVYALSAYAAGLLADRMDRGRLLSLGLVCLVVADLVLTTSDGLAGIAVGVALWGLHMGLTQGLLSTLVADTPPADLRGTAFGMFNLVCGVAMLAASVLAGALWDMFGPGATSLAGALLAAASLVGLNRLQGRFGIARTEQ